MNNRLQVWNLMKRFTLHIQFNSRRRRVSDLDCSDVGAGQGKDITAILPEDGKESQRPIRSQVHAARNKKKRRLNDLESDSTAAESEDEFMLSNR